MPLQRRLPKGRVSVPQVGSDREVRLSELAKVPGEVVDLRRLQDADVMPHSIKRAKVILSGKMERAVTVRGLGVTKGARAPSRRPAAHRKRN